MIKCWEKRTEAILPVFFRFRQVSFYIEFFENFYTKRLQVRKIYLSLHSRLRKTSNTAEHGAVVQLVRMRACHARGRGFEPHPHRLKALHESEGLFRIWHLPKSRIGQAIEYAFALLPRLSRYVNDGRISGHGKTLRIMPSSTTECGKLEPVSGIASGELRST